MIKLAQQLCDDCTPLLISSALRPTREIDVDVLEGVAKARYTLALTAEFMYKSTCLLYTSPSPRDGLLSRMPSSA